MIRIPAGRFDQHERGHRLGGRERPEYSSDDVVLRIAVMAVLCCAFARRMTRTRPGSKGPETYAIRLPSRQGPKVPLHVPSGAEVRHSFRQMGLTPETMS